ncbi:MAG: hypothetical protein ACI9O4_000731 [Chitinophagales bacterium]|jgi:hypothetical protein
MFPRLLFFALLFFASTVYGQKKAFHLGAIANFSSPWIINQNNFGTLDGFNNPFARGSELDYGVTLGGGFGMIGGYNISKRHGLEFALYYDFAGQKYKGQIYQDDNLSLNFPVDVSRSVKLNYIKLPLMYKWELVPKRRSMSKKMNYYFSVGPQIAYLISVYEEVDIDNPNIGNNLAGIGESDKFRKLDIGVILNNGIQYRINKNVYFFTSLNLYVGLIDINGKVIRELDYFSNNDVKYRPSHSFNVALSVGVQYVFVSGGYY